MNEEELINKREYFAQMGRKGGLASRGTVAAKLKGQAAGRESYFQRLFKEFLRHDDLMEALINEYPNSAVRIETEWELEKWLEAAFRVRDDYQIRVKALLTPLPPKKLAHNGV